MASYSVLRSLFAGVTRQFFREIKVRGATPVEQGPALILPNHPNFALDSLLIVTVFKRELWFLAKGTLFANPLMRRLFTWLHMVPVYRRQDDPTQVSKNEETFRLATETLGRGEAIVMFPEGTSMGERKLYPVKTGAARIAFLLESAQQFNAGLVIQPVGLTYRDLVSFQTDVIVTLGNPIRVADYQQEYESDSVKAVHSLTDRIEEELRALSVEVENQDLIGLVEDITELFASAYPDRDDHRLMQTIAENVQLLAPQYPARKEALEARIRAFLSLLSLFRLEVGALNESTRAGIWFYVLCPLALVGAAVFYVPYRVVGSIVPRLLSHPVQTASYKLAIGVLVCGAWILGLCGICVWMGMSTLAAVGVLLGLVVIGLVTNRYLGAAKLFLISLLWPAGQNPVDVLRLLRDQLVSELEQLRVQ